MNSGSKECKFDPINRRLLLSDRKLKTLILKSSVNSDQMREMKKRKRRKYYEFFCHLLILSKLESFEIFVKSAFPNRDKNLSQSRA